MLEATRVRLEREERAAKRARLLDVGGDYSAYDNDVVSYNHLYQRVEVAVSCETHWDACLVLLALGKRVDDIQQKEEYEAIYGWGGQGC